MSVPIPKVLQLTPENRSTNWDLFKQRWNNYEIATGLVNKPEEIKLATLLSTIGEEALIVYNAFNWSQDEGKVWILLQTEEKCDIWKVSIHV